MRVHVPISALVFPLLMLSSTQAADVAKLQKAMNDAQICKPVKLNTKEIRKLLPIKIPDAIPDTDIGIDKDFHVVKSFDVTASSAKVMGTYGCQPSDEAVPFKPPFSQKPEDWRLTDNFECEAQISGTTVSSATCKNSGEVGKIIAAATNVNEKMKGAIQAALQ
ncbi:hypothetical protein GOFOIKOB_4022 [Methylobacterium tardum]|uniref:Uncharacterized protein n=1 Tax=Methylobacterium tardum TaxID=374432 RepID=A0AA37TI46_9HYPH|nr:hypothetical protein [Methylobacterium tardum]URD38186.1 hypothetical protein M6G65_06910 [Methylobacterium tardum]GJE50968.1 hypothetical protein GOFOIKOB_4022 [Methylobacterium tardum]GLS69976.1 hypothetical protein GCM10007890_19890 [Methylobacterium tardum]